MNLQPLKSFPAIISITLLLLGAITIATMFYEPSEKPVVTIDEYQTIPDYQDLLTRENLEESLELGTSFLLNNQKEEGNFNYEYDFISKTQSTIDNEVRQAGALWGLALIQKYSPSEELRTAILKGLEFFDSTSQTSVAGYKYPIYPGDSLESSTGTVALIILAITDFLQTEEDQAIVEKYKTQLDQYINFLLSLRMEDGQFYEHFSRETGEGKGESSPYFDGESLLALAKAAKYTGYKELKSIILESAEEMYKVNVEDALDEDPDSNTTKGFFQWGSMAFYEIHTAGWSWSDKWAKRTIELSDWMIDIHQTLDRSRNTAYAYEGIVSAYELARLIGDDEATEKFRQVIDQGLYKLTTWQVGHSLQNEFLKENPTDDPEAIGGIMNSKDEAPLRIDVTQHQMHAVIMALKYAYE